MSIPPKRLTALGLAIVLAISLAACSRDQEALPNPTTSTTLPQPSTSDTSSSGTVSATPGNPTSTTAATAPPTSAPPPTSTSTSSGVPATTWVTHPATAAPSAHNVQATLPAPTQNPHPAETSGPLHLNSQPRPPDWTPTAAHAPHPTRARDPRHAAWEAMMVGCAPVDRRTWVDPAHALEIAVTRGGRPGVGLILQFGSPEAAQTYHGAFVRQLRACPARPGTNQPGVTALDSSTGHWLGRRTLLDGSIWAEVASVNGSTVRLWILQDAGAMDDVQLRALATHLSA